MNELGHTLGCLAQQNYTSNHSGSFHCQTTNLNIKQRLDIKQNKGFVHGSSM